MCVCLYNCCCSVTKSCTTLVTPQTVACQAIFVLPRYLLEFAQVHVMSIELLMLSNHQLLKDSHLLFLSANFFLQWLLKIGMCKIWVIKIHQL